MYQYWLNKLDEMSIPEPNSGCQLWLHALNADNYGQIRYNGATVLAHRLSYELNKGEIPEGLKVLHKCDVSECINPNHLKVGTQTENVADMDTKGRRVSVFGMRHGKAKFTQKQIDEVIASDDPQWMICEKYSMSPSYVRMLKNGERKRRQ